MRIESTNKLDPQGLVDLTAQQRPAASASAGAEEAGEFLRVESSCGKYIAQAAQAAEVNADAVAEAKRLLAEGKLDTPEAIGRLAGAMLRKGL